MEPQNINDTSVSKANIKLRISHNFALFLIGTIVLGIVALGSYTFIGLSGYRSKSVTVNSNNLAAVDSEHLDTSSWKTYRNDKYGFEFKYPEGWSNVNDNISKTDAKLLLFSGGLSVISTTSSLIHGIGLPPVGSMWVNIMPAEACDDASFENLNSEFVLESKPDTAEKSICLGPFRMYVGLWQVDPNFEQNKMLLSKILSTFKFTK